MKKTNKIQDINYALQMLEFIDLEESSDHFISILENLPIPLWAYNSNGQFIFWNKEAEKILGYTHLHILGKSDLFSLYKSLEKNEFPGEKQFTSQNGKVLILQLHYVQKKVQETGTYTWICGNDITLFKNAETQLNKKLQHLYNLEKILHQSDSFIYIRENDLDWKLTYVTPNFFEFIGLTTPDESNQPVYFATFIHPEDIARIKAEILVAEHEKWDQMHLEYRIVNNYDKILWVSDALEMIRNQQGSVIKYQGVLTDITYRKKAEVKIKEQHKIIRSRNMELTMAHDELKKSYEDLKTAKEKAEESDKLKSAFLANMSHEIRTPMNGILGFANLLNDPKITEDQRNNFIEIINQNGNILLKLIDDILDIAKIEAGQLTIYEKPIFINQLLYDEYLLFKALIDSNKAKSLQFRLVLPPFNLEEEIMVDPARLKQIITNLLGNALKFTETGFIEFGYELESPAWIKFFVKDTGIGLPKDKYDVIFDRFRQADESQSKKYGGTGLGLTISSNLVKLMKGKMWVESEINKGTIFYFKIPFKTVKKTFKKTTIDVPSHIKTDFFWEKSIILIAEDENVNYSYLQEILKSTRAIIIRAKNGREAIEICKSNPDIDLVLMDIKMPEINGYIATREIKKIRQDLPIIAQTAYAMEDEKDKCFASGCDAYLSKPTDRTKLLFTIDNFLSVKNNN